MQKLARLMAGALSAGLNKRKIIYPCTPVPENIAGTWQSGIFPMNEFWQYNGYYRSRTDMYTLRYMIAADGSTEEFCYADINNEAEQFQLLSYRSGTVTFDKENSTLRFYATYGNCRTYCGNANSWCSYADKDLYPIYAPTYENCIVYNGISLLCVDDNNNVLQFRKMPG
ncbi:MAG: hypothetical protein QM731_05755 [Chitinophagaceae bacterium]